MSRQTITTFDRLVYQSSLTILHHYEVRPIGRAILADGRTPATTWVALRHSSQSQRARIRQLLLHDELPSDLSAVQVLLLPLHTSFHDWAGNEEDFNEQRCHDCLICFEIFFSFGCGFLAHLHILHFVCYILRMDGANRRVSGRSVEHF